MTATHIVVVRIILLGPYVLERHRKVHYHKRCRHNMMICTQQPTQSCIRGHYNVTFHLRHIIHKYKQMELNSMVIYENFTSCPYILKSCTTLVMYTHFITFHCLQNKVTMLWITWLVCTVHTSYLRHIGTIQE